MIAALKPIRGTTPDRSHWMMRGLRLWLPMWEGSGGTVYDVSGFGHHGALTAAMQWAGGRDGSALGFDGAASTYVDLNDDLTTFAFIQNTAVFWISAAVQLAAPTANRVDAIIGNTPGASADKGFWLAHDNRNVLDPQDRGLRISLTRGVTQDPVVSLVGAGLIADTAWHRVDAWGDGDTVYIALDGAFTSSLPIGSLSSGGSTRETHIGRANHSSVFFPLSGRLGDLRIYDTSFTGALLDPWAPFRRQSPARFLFPRRRRRRSPFMGGLNTHFAGGIQA